jgi:hypothetical protein
VFGVHDDTDGTVPGNLPDVSKAYLPGDAWYADRPPTGMCAVVDNSPGGCALTQSRTRGAGEGRIRRSGTEFRRPGPGGTRRKPEFDAARLRTAVLFAERGERRDFPDEFRPQRPGQVMAHA